MSDSEIKDMLLEIRFEKAMAAELAATANIIKKTGMFDNVDRIYGDYEAMNGGGQQVQQGEGEDDGLGGGGGGLGGGLGGDLGGDMDMDLGEPGAEEGSDLGGETGETDMGSAPSADSGEPLMENRKRKLPNIYEVRKNVTPNKAVKSFTQCYFDLLAENSKKKDDIVEEVVDFYGKTATMEDRIRQVCSTIDNLVNEEHIENENLINEAVSALSIDNDSTYDDEDTDELI